MKGQVVEVELSVELNDEVVNVNDDVYLTDFVSTESLLFSQATGAVDTKVVVIRYTSLLIIPNVTVDMDRTDGGLG